jgi:hypothetical protein
LAAELISGKDSYTFSGTVSAYKHVASGITHSRTITKMKDKPEWHITDKIAHKPSGIIINQLWHVPTLHKEQVIIQSTDEAKIQLQPNNANGWYSSLYGVKESASEICFSTESDVINTIIELT